MTNTGGRRGCEVVQCLRRRPARRGRFGPARELRAFAKVALDPGETTTVELALDNRSFASWDAAEHEWVVEAGRYEVALGRSSADTARVVAVDVGADRFPA